ncbi:MAG TPA: cache domain-containing protein, partial [Candidatus Syntrophosphaera sp.]|nr:cache domain-containing protein [Candidatus Syntrophosphaera sp.]
MKTGSHSLAYQLIWFVWLALLLIFIASYIVINHFVTGVMQANAEFSMGYQAKATANLIDRDLSQIMVIGKSLRDAVVHSHAPGWELDQMILHHLDENPSLASICVAPVTPGIEAPKMYLSQQATSPDSCLSKTDALHPDATAPSDQTSPQIFTLTDSDYRYKDWYQIPLLTRQNYWSDPWFDRSGAPCLICSYSLLIWEQDEIIGILRLDMRLSGLQRIVRSIRVGQNGYAFLLASNGTIVSHPRDSLAMNYTIFDLAELRQDPEMRSVYRRALNSPASFVPLHNSALFENAWLYTMPLPNLNWTLALIIDHAEVTADLKRLLFIIIGAFFAAFLIIGALIWGRTKRINRPLRQLANSLAGVGAGRLDISLPPPPRVYELEVLTQAYSRMTDSLKQYIVNLRTATQEQERIASELMFAASVQQK